MSIIAGTRTPTADTHRRPGVKIAWSQMDTGDSGSWIECNEYPDKCVHISGTVGVFALQGSNEPLGANPFNLTDFDGSAIAGAGGFQIRENPLMIRPVVTNGTDVIVTIYAR